MKGHYVVLFPILTNIKKQIDVYAEYTYEKYMHQMQLFSHWDNHEPTQSWTIPIPDSVTKCKKFICDILQKTGLPHPAYIKLVKTIAERHAYILLYTNTSVKERHKIASKFEGHFPLQEDGYRTWKWRTYWHMYTPWLDGDNTSEDESKNEDRDDNNLQKKEDDTHLSDIGSQFEEMSLGNTETKAMNADLESSHSEEDLTKGYETISVYDYIMEESAMNQYHMLDVYPLCSTDCPLLSKNTSASTKYRVTLQELCSALSDIDIQKI